MKSAGTHTRRSWLKGAALASSGALLGPGIALGQAPGARKILSLPVMGQPDLLSVMTGVVESERHILFLANSAWSNKQVSGVRVEFLPGEQTSSLWVESVDVPLQRIHLRWNLRLPHSALALGDAWERSYGDLGWLPLQAERAMPWYTLIHADGHTAGAGVKTGAASLAFWQADPNGLSLWLDLRNGSNGVQLGQRRLLAATIVTYSGRPGETAFAVTQRLCGAMAGGTSIPTHRGAMPVRKIIGSNDWYYAYGRNTPAGILRDADLVRALAPPSDTQPFTVIDDGYQNPSVFPDMGKLAGEIRSRQVRPGLWIRPLKAVETTASNLLLPSARCRLEPSEKPSLAYDPTIPEALHAIAAVVTQACDWGYDLIKHDFSTYELFGQWGSQMGASPALGNWHLNDTSLTNAEVVTALYRQLRKASGPDRILLGCNTIGHLSVGIFDASRTGDDVSGVEWERTRRTGINTLAFRLPQHSTFFALDADCIPLTPEVPWSMSKQWLSAVAQSGTVLLISPDRRAIGAEQRSAIRDAFARVFSDTQSQPLDWLETRTPALWQTSGESQGYDWILPEGESPFPIGIPRSTD
jgi:alpha-galactosidase